MSAGWPSTAGAALRGAAVAAEWDPELATVMLASGRAVYEEQVIPDLIEDLARDGG